MFIKYLLITVLKARWAYFHISPMYIKFSMSDTESHFQHRSSGVIESNYIWED